MKTSPARPPHPAGYVSYLMVLGTGTVLLVMMLGAYRGAIDTQEAQAATTLRVDYATKEESVLRAIVPIAANRAMRCMQADSINRWDETSWEALFRQAILEANAEDSVDAEILTEFGIDHAVEGNPGDALTWVDGSFRGVLDGHDHSTSGINQDFGPGFPPPLQTSDGTVTANDHDHPLITSEKAYDHLAEGRVLVSVEDYPQFNLLEYPNIRFGYAEPGQPFVAKRNWWTFRLDLSASQRRLTGAAARDRQFVLSIYEVPSQLAISAEAFTLVGHHSDGSAWQNTSIEGGIFSTRARVSEGVGLERISGRRGLDISSEATIGENQFATDPFAPGQREQYEITNAEFLPVSLASEAGRAAFIPINRGPDFFDRYAHDSDANTLSPTTWNDYTIGARQCAMSMDITEVRSAMDATPTGMRFSYLKNGVRESIDINLEIPSAGTSVPAGFKHVATEHADDTVTFENPTDVMYGANGSYYYQYGVTGTVTFNNARFGDPKQGVTKYGYARPASPFPMERLHDVKPCIMVYPERLPAFLSELGADGPEINNSISINVDYPNNAYIQKPSIPCTELDYGVILEECADLTPFTKGFSLVTNLRLYIGDDFNTVPTTPPVGSGLPEPYYPACSLFAPEKRYGAEYDPLKLKLSGQLGSLAGDSGEGGDPVNLLDLKGGSEVELGHEDLEVNLAPINHPAALPPINMMNWLVVIEEVRQEFYIGRGTN